MRKGQTLVYLFIPFFVIYILFILTPIFRTLTYESFSLVISDASSGILKSIYYTYILAFVVAAIAVAFSIPYVYFVSRTDSSLVKVADSLVELPIMIPHTVVGIMMLITFEPSMPIGKLITKFYPGYQFLDTFLAVIVTLFFLSSAYTIRTVQVSYSRDVMKYEDVGRTLGMGSLRSYFTLGIPMMGRAMLRGLILSWARSISEVGSLLIVAYYILPGIVNVAGVFIYSQFQSGNLPGTVASSSILILTGLAALLAFKLLEGKK
ncbi:MAG: ABC transporter permease [Candidatus Thermoplasmatota archaeon]|jgi:molybdate/tungstate transport system permease protein|nr:ABC transporter permease [Candidatus Thermoplasmatota archaeon]